MASVGIMEQLDSIAQANDKMAESFERAKIKYLDFALPVAKDIASLVPKYGQLAAAAIDAAEQGVKMYERMQESQKQLRNETILYGRTAADQILQMEGDEKVTDRLKDATYNLYLVRRKSAEFSLSDSIEAEKEKIKELGESYQKLSKDYVNAKNEGKSTQGIEHDLQKTFLDKQVMISEFVADQAKLADLKSSPALSRDKLFGDNEKKQADERRRQQAEEQKRQAEEAARIMVDLDYREATLGKSREERALMEIDQRHAAEYQSLLDLHATQDQLDQAERVMRAERDALENEQYLEKKKALDEAVRQSQSQQYEAAWQGLSGMVGQVGGDIGAGLGMMTSGLKGMSDVAEGKDANSTEIENLQTKYTESLALMAEHENNKYALTEEQEQRMLDLKQSMADAEQQIEQQKEQQKLSIASSAAGTMAGLMQTLAQTQGKHSKAAFEAYKAFSIAQTIIDTYKAAQSAYSALAGIPIVGPALGVAAAAAAIMAGMARVQAIRSQQPGGSAAASTSSGGASVSAPTVGTTPTLPEKPATEDTQPTQVVNVHVYGNIVDHDAFARELIPSIQKATSDGVR